MKDSTEPRGWFLLLISPHLLTDPSIKLHGPSRKPNSTTFINGCDPECISASIFVSKQTSLCPPPYMINIVTDLDGSQPHFISIPVHT